MKKTLIIGGAILALVVAIILCVILFSGGATGSGSNKVDTMAINIETFHSKVSESQELLDTVADDIYSNWYDAIYKDKFNENINTAIAMARLDNADNLEKIEALDKEISDLFKDVKDSEHSKLIKDIMAAYSDYYEFVVNVSGSFNSYSADKETLKKELASLLRDLSYEI